MKTTEKNQLRADITKNRLFYNQIFNKYPQIWGYFLLFYCRKIGGRIKKNEHGRALKSLLKEG